MKLRSLWDKVIQGVAVVSAAVMITACGVKDEDAPDNILRLRNDTKLCDRTLVFPNPIDDYRVRVASWDSVKLFAIQDRDNREISYATDHYADAVEFDGEVYDAEALQPYDEYLQGSRAQIYEWINELGKGANKGVSFSRDILYYVYTETDSSDYGFDSEEQDELVGVIDDFINPAVFLPVKANV